MVAINTRLRVRTAAVYALRQAFRKRPWEKSRAEQLEVADELLGKLAEVYGIPKPTVDFGRGLGNAYARSYWPFYHIRLSSARKLSLVTLMHEFRHLERFTNKPESTEWSEQKQELDAQSWAVSAFRLAVPRAYEKMVRDGRIAGVKKGQ